MLLLWHLSVLTPVLTPSISDLPRPSPPSSPFSFIMEYDVHTLLDALTLLATGMAALFFWQLSNLTPVLTTSAPHTLPLLFSFMMEYDVHTLLDALTLLATGVVIGCMLLHPQIRTTYQKEQDRIKWYFVVGVEVWKCGKG